MDLRPVLFICGLLLVGTAAAMVVPALVEFAFGHGDWAGFLFSAGATLFVGGALSLTNRRTDMRLGLRQAFAITTFALLFIAAFAALPFVTTDLGLGYTDAFFEAMSGVTTTGSTIIIGLDRASPGLLVWRAMLQWFGGIGVVVIALAFLPILRVGGMQLFRVETFDSPEKALPGAAQVITSLGRIYLGLTAFFALALWAAGMTAFDAILHAMTGISTGGFSTHDDSVAFFADLAVEWTLIGCMIVGGLPFLYFLDVVRGRPQPLLRDRQVHAFLVVIAASAAFITLLLVDLGVPGGRAISLAMFNVVSVITGTGFATADYSLWGGLGAAILLTLMLVGGCAGSTTGGIKIFRFLVAYAIARVQIARLLVPHGVFVPRYNRRPVGEEAAGSVMAFFFVFALSFAVLGLALGALGLDFVTSLSGAAAAIANVGPGVGPLIGPAGSYANLPDTAKWLLAGGMLLGRLELFTVLVLFTRAFWRA